jgi:diacylglycerol kinase family enzyme
MNAEWLGDLDLGVRAHPGDGLLDITDGRLTLRDRLTARHRARTGTHLPHPTLRTSRAASFHTTFEPPLTIRLDGVRHGKVHNLSIRLETDAALVIL